MKTFDPDLSKFITEKQKQAAEGHVANTENPAGLVDGTIDTNAGLFRAYMAMYLNRHPFVNTDLLSMVRTLAPTENGLPMQVYCFSSNKDWPRYESIQSEIMEHFASVLPVFGLYPTSGPMHATSSSADCSNPGKSTGRRSRAFRGTSCSRPKRR